MKIDKNILTGKYKKLYFCISEILFDNDIENINFGFNDDEYESEVNTILPRLPDCQNVEDVQQVIFEEFNYWFGSNRDLEDFAETAKEIWVTWITYKNGWN